ncbi:MAG: type II toxin-antitoxin system HicB family antitoxin [Chloroflexota bacterium]|nr:MAG: type II toxin-antitoxin system HicB family antitoxin [Chloroflexota bacterium]
MKYKLPIEVDSLAEGGFFSVCPILQGCQAEGETIAEALENVQDVARNFIELMAEVGVINLRYAVVGQI